MTDCKHENFAANVNVGRITEVEGGPVTSYCADIIIKCGQCGTEFEFIGVPAGISPDAPMVSIDFKELRVPIRPDTKSIASSATFKLKPSITKHKEIN